MAGHSKWANTKHRKGRQDAKKAKIFTKLARAITVASREGGQDPEYNTALANAIDKAKAENMPNDNIDRAIKKGAGGDNSENFETITYEGYGPNGTAFIVSCLTDNKNRTAADVRHYFSKFGGNLGSSGCVSYLFDRLGIIALELDESADEDEVMMEALENGADDVRIENGIAEIITAPENFSQVSNAYKNTDYKILGADISMIPQNEVSVTDEESIKLILKLIDHLEDNDDVQEIYHNCNLPEDAEL
ncbi:DNA-binding regulatory protein, YebC/PmpR family [Dethiosulfatibacter aminovorans DSM 17477]|uniref:Probable transcriptional regulatory protein SAMN02745751_00761 n=1 Tax=Dethiosulfatibacter aminovorans DSM 17477 TaxID=1121476 RepID=A0A1M6D2Y1_9FIRM|nr:YebC/PmpR family DNA-binding transcriptional regulator [Dethiosulfatibacter aminovorans]SHI67473.1 DNA-binding regulatory protein, YebC/PmpR family [Dethiosulfatibacter aminovorans DSM 17477]